MTANSYLLADAEARDRIVGRLDLTLFVEASAGTGKTAALVDRFLALVLAGRSVERIVAITFTDKAAAELRDRVRQGLEARLKQDCSAEERALITRALEDLDRAQISTIHAFCQSLLRSFAVRAGIDPAFEIEDVVAAERRFEERWRSYLDSLGSHPNAVAAVGRLLDLGLTTYNLQDLAKSLWERTELAYRLQVEPLTAPIAEWPDLGMLREDLKSIDMSQVPSDDRLRERIEKTVIQIGEISAARAEERDAYLASIALDLNPSVASAGNQPNWRGSGDLNEARETTRHVIVTLIETLADLRSRALSDALPLIVDFVTSQARERRTEGRLIFDDLILGVRDVLREYPDARYELRQRFDTILIDEFQDTDPMQAEIALAFAAAGDDALPGPGRLFLVGDPKQSIYRFRRADMATYAAMASQIAASGGETLDLALNRRSRPDVLEWVNHVFEHVFGETIDLEVQPPYKPVYPHRSDAIEGPSVSWFGEAIPKATATQVRQMEAQHIAAHCRAVVARGWQVAERNGTVRPARYGDIAVLLPARTILQALERSLAREGIPYRVEGGSLVYATQEVRDLLNCLTAIDDPSDEVAVVAALRSPAYACSDVEIARYRLHGGSFNYLSPALAQQSDGLVVGGLRNLRAWHEMRVQLSLAVLVERFVADRRLVEIGLLDSGNRNAYRRARFLVEQARVFEAGGPESLRSFLEWLERRAGDAILDSEGASLDDDEDAVRVLTVHAAKGLEFPIVFLAGLGAQPPNTQFIFGHERNDGSIAVTIGAKSRGAQFKLGPVDAVTLHEQAHAAAERARLLYVAATRARDHLVLSLFHPESAKESAAARLVRAGARDLAEVMPLIEISHPAPRRPFEGLEPDMAVWDEATFEAERTALVARARLQHYTSATALGRQEEDREQREDETEPWSRGRAGTHLGRAVHAALQTLSWDASDAAIEAVATAQTVAEAIPHMAKEAAELIRTALRSEAAQRALASKRALREVPFALPHGTTILEGYVDLLLESPDGGIEIIDWKTDHVASDEVETRLKEYELQAGVYVLGIEAATGREVSRVTYVFVSPGRSASPGEPSLLKAAALARLDSMSLA